MPREQRTQWDEASTQQLQALHREGKTPEQIARQMKHRLGAVKGKLHRLGLMTKGGAATKNAVAPNAERKQQRKSPFIFNGGPSVAPTFFPEPDIGTVPRLVPTGQLEADDCKWVVGDTLRHCGHTQAPGSVYCPGHHKVAYTGERIDGEALARAYGWLA